MGYVASKNIRIFPTSNRSTNNGTNWVTEYNLAGILRSILSEKSFVISDAPEGGKPFEFVINGYYVKVADWTNIEGATDEGSCTLVVFEKTDGDNENSKVVAKVKETKGAGADDSFSYIKGDDAGTKPSIDSGDSEKTLTLAVRKSDKWEVPASSRLNLVKLYVNALAGITIGPTGSIAFSKGSSIKGNPKGALDFSEVNVSGGTFSGVTIGPTGALQSSFSGILNQPTGSLGAISLTGDIDADGHEIRNGVYSGQLKGPSGTLGNVYAEGALGPTGAGTIAATSLTDKAGITITAAASHTSDDNNLARLFKLDDGEL